MIVCREHFFIVRTPTSACKDSCVRTCTNNDPGPRVIAILTVTLEFSPVGSAGMDNCTGGVGEIVAIAQKKGLNLRVESAILDDNGWDFRVVHVTDVDGVAWVLRAPRRQEVAVAAIAERKLLTVLHGRFEVAIPNWHIADGDLIAYRRLPGEPAAWEDPVTFQLKWRIDRLNPPRQYVDTLGRFMAELHATPLKDILDTGIPVRPSEAVRTEITDQMAYAAAELDMHQTWRERGARWLDTDELWTDTVVLIHGDLHPGHELVADDGTLLGILDWTDALVGDPAQEFVEAARKFDPPVLDQLIDTYLRHGGHPRRNLRAQVVELIAFAPLALGVVGLRSGKQRYVEAARAYLSRPT